MATAMKKFTNNFQAFLERMSLPNHGFNPVSSIKRCKFPHFPVPIAAGPDRILIRDPKHIKGKLRKMKREGLSQFKIVTDFDATLTKSFHDGRKVQASFGILKENLINPELKELIEERYRIYKFDDQNNDLNKIEKTIQMDNWISSTMAKVVESNITIDSLSKLLEEAYVIPRAQLDTFLGLCKDYHIPIYTISAGISNIIAAILDNYVDLNKYPNFHIYANEMLFNEKGDLYNFSVPHIHTFTKDDIFQRNQTYRKNHLLIGDLLHDVLTTKNIQPRFLVSVGYLNYNPGYQVEQVIYDYARKYDIVILTDESLALPELITRYVLDLESEYSLFKYLDDHIVTIDEGKNYLMDAKRKIDEIVKERENQA